MGRRILRGGTLAVAALGSLFLVGTVFADGSGNPAGAPPSAQPGTTADLVHSLPPGTRLGQIASAVATSGPGNLAAATLCGPIGLGLQPPGHPECRPAP